ncbi:hypothetical protein WJX84_009910 [Apatococcus fuscideae]|uniref:SKI-interacting protein SKIP SNW domain-containing protein n=1 Tax=Apatococcus fuscideae TaxID=2026836 RepID=A0AAW1TC11_9CHLO
MLAAIPAPVHEHARPLPAPQQPVSMSLMGTYAKETPPYGTKERKVQTLRKPEDYGDGGAFPEIQKPQYPLNMGKEAKQGISKTGKTLAVTTNADGEISWDAIVRQGRNKDKTFETGHSALVPKVTGGAPELPDEEEVEKTARETAAAIGMVVDNKIQAENPKTIPAQPGAATYIKYTPAQQGAQYNSGAGQRIIKMQEMAVDPMQPPKFRHKKVPRGPGSPPVPVMHSPPRPVTVKEQQDWKIPPCISNWKNAKGYTIPLDKRLAADGRGLQEVSINDQFAKFTESLYIAEQQARQAVEMRSKVQRELLAKDKERKEMELRNLAMRARLDRVGPPPLPAGLPEAVMPSSRGGEAGESRQERQERQRREEIREDRRRERERERRLDARDAHGVKKSKLTRDRDRDVSERIALGQAHIGGGGGGEAMYDQRLFNQDQGMGSGLAADDTYNMYDKPLFADRGNGLYKPRAAADEDDSGNDPAARSFKPDKGFAGVDYSAKQTDGAAPQFERDPAEADPFGLDQFMSNVKQGKRKAGALDGIGQGGALRAGGGGGSYDDYAGGSSRSRMEFSRGQA